MNFSVFFWSWLIVVWVDFQQGVPTFPEEQPESVLKDAVVMEIARNPKSVVRMVVAMSA